MIEFEYLHAPDKTDELIDEFVAEGGDFRNWRPSHNIAPIETIPVLIQSAQGDGVVVSCLEPARWSLVRTCSKTLKLKFPTFNSRSADLAGLYDWWKDHTVSDADPNSWNPSR